MKVAVIGTGYVGLVTGVGLASIGHEVTCLDMRPSIVESLTAGHAPIFEPGLDELLGEMLKLDRIRFSLPDEDVLASADIVIIAVGTPSKDGDIDLSQIRGASELVARALLRATTPTTVVVKSTVVPGTTSTLVRDTIEQTSGLGLDAYGLGMNPEFLREGSAVVDFTAPDRIVLGHENQQALDALLELYAQFTCPKLEVNTKTAELIKYANNMFLAMQISAANEIANIAATLDGVDPLAVMNGVIADHRWSGGRGASGAPGIEKYLVPGPGFGGSCFPKDVEALREFGKSREVSMEVSTAILSVNARQPRVSLARMLTDAPALAGSSVLVLGLAFKPDTDDVRESPAIEMVRYLRESGAVVHAHDPLAIDAFSAIESMDIEFVDDWRDAAGRADVVLVVTPWGEYHELPRAVLAGTFVLDPRRAYSSAEFSEGVQYRSIGIN